MHLHRHKTCANECNRSDDYVEEFCENTRKKYVAKKGQKRIEAREREKVRRIEVEEVEGRHAKRFIDFFSVRDFILSLFFPLYA